MNVGVVLDNGAASIKAGKIALGKTVEIPDALVASNALARPAGNATSGKVGGSRRPPGMLVGAEIEMAPDYTSMSFRRAHERGYVARWDVERDVWLSIFSADMGIGLSNPSESRLLVTEPLASPSHMRKAMDELVFETFGFAEYAAVPPARLAVAAPMIAAPMIAAPMIAAPMISGGQQRHPQKSHTALVLDSGFSFTHAIPVVDGLELRSCARRLNLGGKALTNHLKELVSFRSWNMMDETAIVNAVKERVCFVSQDFCADLRICKDKRNTAIRREYILPDLSRGGADPLGHCRTENEELDGSEQILVMNNERLSVPELLFHPSDIGLHQAGVAELVFQAVEACPVQYRATLYANIILTGGNCRFPGFCERLQTELRPVVSEYYRLTLFMDEDPIGTAYRGGIAALSSTGSLPLGFVSRAEYEEHGSRLTTSRFHDPTSAG